MIYLGGDLKTRCDFKNQSIEITNHILFNTVGKIEKYLDLPPDLNALEGLKFDLKPGDCFISDALQLHSTTRSGLKNSGRISLDMRFTLSDPYDEYNAFRTYEDIKSTWLLKYWYISERKFVNFDDKVSFELEKIENKFGRGKEYDFRCKNIDEILNR